MARKYDTVEIEGNEYELHTVKANDKKIGRVPIRLFYGPESFKNFVESATPGDIELMITDYKYGLAVRLQGMARKCVAGEGFSDAAMNKTYNTLTQDECASFQGDHAGLVKFCKGKWETMQADGAEDYGEDYIWDDLVQ